MKSITHSSSSRRKINYYLLVLFGISILIYIFRQLPIFEFFQGEIQRSISSQKSFFYSLSRQNESDLVKKLKKENLDLNSQLANFELTKQDNIALRSQFESSGIESLALSQAKILGFTGNNVLPETLVINIGQKEGIKKGMPVVFQKYLIGKISDVSLNFSLVTTVFNPKFQTLAKVPSTGANGILFGNKDFMILDRVVITDKLEENGIVVTRGEVDRNGIGIFPDLIIGKMISISKNEAAPFQGAQVGPIIDFSRLTNVFVIVSL